MNKDHWGFKGKKELTLMGDIKGKTQKGCWEEDGIR